VKDAKILLMKLIEFGSIADFMGRTIWIGKMSVRTSKELIACDEKNN
jgi:hypothetical protein